jgi:phage anti-repressor protein
MITINNYNHFKKSYDLALNEGKEVFIFEGSEVLTDYAKYVIQYFESKMGDLKI